MSIFLKIPYNSSDFYLFLKTDLMSIITCKFNIFSIGKESIELTLIFAK